MNKYDSPLSCDENARRFQKLRLIFVHEASTVYSYSSSLSDNPMRTEFMKKAGPHARYASTSAPPFSAGWITELSYSDQQPGMMQMLLLPLLQQLSLQSRWQLWLTPAHKLNREWLQQSGLPLEKSMHIAHSDRYSTVEAMVKALRTGNYSVVVAWIHYDLNEQERGELEKAAAEGQAPGLILRATSSVKTLSRPVNPLKIQSTLFH